jgi:hypothetical protein
MLLLLAVKGSWPILAVGLKKLSRDPLRVKKIFL